MSYSTAHTTYMKRGTPMCEGCQVCTHFFISDFEFLLRFIRARKFSQLGARQTLENYWTCKSKTPEWYKDLDPTDPTIVEILKTG